MLDLNALQVFEKVAALRSFSAAARELDLPKSTVSRQIVQLESELGTRLLQRTTREVTLTESGMALRERCTDIVARIHETIDHVSRLGATPQGVLRVSTSVSFGVNVLSDLLPQFVESYPEVNVLLELTSQATDLVAHGIDIAFRIGPLPDSELVGSRLGTMRRYLCAAPAYLQRHGEPLNVAQLREHAAVELTGPKGRARTWTFTDAQQRSEQVDILPRISVNDPLTIHRLLRNGAGVGVLSEHLCAVDLAAGQLVRLLPDWTPPSLDVTVLYPSNRGLAPAVRAFVEFTRRAAALRKLW